jgi:hypothetical protein
MPRSNARVFAQTRPSSNARRSALLDAVLAAVRLERSLRDLRVKRLAVGAPALHGRRVRLCQRLLAGPPGSRSSAAPADGSRPMDPTARNHPSRAD